MKQVPSHIYAYYCSLNRAGVWPMSENVIKAQAGSASAGEIISLQVRYQGTSIVDSCFQVHGCPYAIAVAAYLADWVIGKNASQLKVINMEDLVFALQLPESKYHAALLGMDVLTELAMVLPQ